MKSFTALPTGWFAHYVQDNDGYERYPIIGVQLDTDSGDMKLVIVDGSGFIDELEQVSNFSGITAPDEDGYLPGAPSK